MKFIFFGPSKEIDLLTQKFDKNTFSIHKDVDEVLNKVKEGPSLVFINFDFNAEHAKKINDHISQIEGVKRIVFSKTRDLKKEKISADEYILGPLNKASFENAFQEVMGGKTISTFITEPKSYDSDVNRSIQDAFDTVFTVSKLEETPEATRTKTSETPIKEEELPKAEPAKKAPEGEAILDEESDLQFSVGGMEIPTEAKPSTTESPEQPKIEEPKVEEPTGKSEPSGLALDESQTPAPSEEAAGPGDLEIPSLGDELPSLELGGGEEPSAPAPDLGMDLDLGAPDSTVVAPSPKPMEKPSQPTSEVLPSDPSMEFSASLGEESVKKEESKEFIFEKPRSTEEMKDLFAKSEPKKVEEKVGVKVSDESVIKLEAIIRALREEREQLLKEVNENKNIKDKLLAENLNREAEVEELRVELSIVKKRNEEEFHEESYEKRNLKEKLSVAEEKNQRLQKDLDILNQQAKIDTNKILQKEKDLESQLELLSIDSQNQILSREKKISELKRERDTMEYNMTNLVSREKKLRQEKIEIEEKLNKIMRTMRSSIQFLEEEIEGNENLFKELKK